MTDTHTHTHIMTYLKVETCGVRLVQDVVSMFECRELGGGGDTENIQGFSVHALLTIRV